MITSYDNECFFVCVELTEFHRQQKWSIWKISPAKTSSSVAPPQTPSILFDFDKTQELLFVFPDTLFVSIDWSINSRSKFVHLYSLINFYTFEFQFDSTKSRITTPTLTFELTTWINEWMLSCENHESVEFSRVREPQNSLVLRLSRSDFSFQMKKKFILLLWIANVVKHSIFYQFTNEVLHSKIYVTDPSSVRFTVATTTNMNTRIGRRRRRHIGEHV